MILGIAKRSKIYSGKIVKMKHQLSHQTIHAKFYEFIRTKPYKTEGGLLDKAVSTKELRTYALPRLIEKFLEQNP